MDENKKIKEIKLYNNIDKLLLNGDYLKHIMKDEDVKEEELEILIEEKRLKWLKEKIYKLKENLIYNNLSTEYLNDLNLSNLSYYKTYFEIFKNFDSEDYLNLIILRMNFLENIIEKAKKHNKEKLINTEKIISEITNENNFPKQNKSLLINEKDDFESETEKTNFNQIFSVISSLFSVILLYDIHKTEYSKTKEEIISRLFNNLNILSDKIYFSSIFGMQEIEKNLLILVNLTQQNLLSENFFVNNSNLQKENKIINQDFSNEDYLNFISDILEKLLTITAKLNSFTTFFKLLFILKENNFTLKNYNYLIENILNPKIHSLIKPPDERFYIKEFELNVNDYFCNCEFIKSEIFTDENFIYFYNLILKDQQDLILNFVKIDKGLNYKDTSPNKILDFKFINIKENISNFIYTKLKENLKKDIQEKDSNYPEYINNLRKLINSEIKIKIILNYSSEVFYILLNEKNKDVAKILKIKKENFHIIETFDLNNNPEHHSIFNIFCSREAFYIFKKQINEDDKNFNHEKLDIFDTENKEKTEIYELERINFEKEEFSRNLLTFDYLKISEKGIKDFIEFCKQDLDIKFHSLFYLNNKIIFFEKNSEIKNFYKIDINSFFSKQENKKEENLNYFSLIELNKTKNLEKNLNFYYDITSNLIYGFTNINKILPPNENIENFKIDTTKLNYRVYYNFSSFPSNENSVYELINNNKILDLIKELDLILEKTEDNIKVEKSDSQNINLIKCVSYDTFKDLTGLTNENKINLSTPLKNYKNICSLFIKNSDLEVENLIKEKKSNKKLNYLNCNEKASSLYFEIVYRSLSNYIISNSNIISTMKNIKKINSTVYQDIFKNHYPKFVYHFGKNISSELFNVIYQKSFLKLAIKLEDKNCENLLNSNTNENELLLLDFILLENLFDNFKNLKMGFFENYFDIENLKKFSNLLLRILSFKLNLNKNQKLSSNKNTEIEIYNFTVKILIIIFNNLKNYSFIFQISNIEEFLENLIMKSLENKYDFSEENGYFFYFISLFLNSDEIKQEKKYKIVEFFLKSEIFFVENQKNNIENLGKFVFFVKNKLFEKSFNNTINYIIREFTATNNDKIENLNNPESNQIKLLNILNENFINLITVLKNTDKKMLENKKFKKYFENFSLIINSNFIIFNLIFRLYHNEYIKLTTTPKDKKSKTLDQLNFELDTEDILIFEDKEFFNFIKDERKEISFLIFEKILLLLFYLNDFDSHLINKSEKNGFNYDLITDKVFTCDSEHPQNIKTKSYFNFDFQDKNEKFLKFDYLSRINNKSSIDIVGKFDQATEKDIKKQDSSIDKDKNPENPLEDKNKIDLELNTGYLKSEYMKIKNSKNLKSLNFKYELNSKFEELINANPENNIYIDENYKFYGFKFKLFNFEDPYMTDNYLIKNLKRLLIFLSCKIFDLILLNPENINLSKKKNNLKIEEKFYQEIFSSKLLNNISLINSDFILNEIKNISKDLKNEQEDNEKINDIFIFSNLKKINSLFENLNKNLKKHDMDLIKYLNTSENSEKDELNNKKLYDIDLNLDFFCDMENSVNYFKKDISKTQKNLKSCCEEKQYIKSLLDSKEDLFSIPLKVIYKNFLIKNPWGKVGGKQIDKIINIIFIVCLKHTNLFSKYNAFILQTQKIISEQNISIKEENFEKIISQELNNLIINFPNYNLFLKIYSECSKIRLWFNEKKTFFTDININKPNLNLKPTLSSSNIKISNSSEIVEPVLNEIKEENKHKEEDSNLINIINEEEKFDNFIMNLINTKLFFLLEIKNFYLFNDTEKLNLENNVIFNKNIQDIIDSIFNFLKSENIKTELLIKKINNQNSKALNKEAFLILFNLMICILKNQNEIQDLLYWINAKFKDTEFIIDFNKDLYASDPKLIHRVYNQFYNFIFILVQKLKNLETEKNQNYSISKFSTMGLVNIFQSLVWKIRKSDFQFYKNNGFFDIFSSKGIISNILSLSVESQKNIPNLKEFDTYVNNFNYETIETYGKNCYDINFLQNFIFDSFSIFSLQILNKFHVKNYEEDEIKTDLILCKKTSVLSSNEEFVVIDIISSILVHELNKYIENWKYFIYEKDKIKKNEFIPHLNEDKLNSYLILLYRSLSFNNYLINHFTFNHPCLFPNILEIFLYCNEKNKILIIKFIDLFMRFYNEEYLTNSFENFVENTKNIFGNLIKLSLENTYYSCLYLTNYEKEEIKISEFDKKIKNFDSEKFSFKNFGLEKIPDIGFKFLLEYLFIITKSLLNSDNKINSLVKFFKTNSDKEIGFDFLNLFRNNLKTENDSNKIMKKFILSKIQTNFNKIEKEKVLINYSDRILILLILGVDLCPLRVGQKVAFEQVYREKDTHAYDIYEYSFTSTKNKNFINKKNEKNLILNLENESDNLQLGVIVGFTNSSNNPFIIDVSMNEFSCEEFSYSPDKRFAVVVVENTLNKNNMKNLNFETVVIDIEKLIIRKENPIDELNLHNIIKESNLSDWMFEYISEEIKNEKNDKFKFISLKFFLNMIIRKEKTIILEEIQENEINIANTLKKEESFVSFFKNLPEKNFKNIINALEYFSLFSLKSKIRTCTLEKLENDNIYELISENLQEGTDNQELNKEQELKRKNSLNENFSFMCSFNKTSNSIAIKYCGNFIKEIELEFIYNMHKISEDKNIFYYIISIDDYINLDLTTDEKSNYIILGNSEEVYNKLFNHEINKKIKNSNFVKYIISDNSLLDKVDFNKSFNDDQEYFIIPTLLVSQIDFIKLSGFVFEGAMDEDFSYLLSCPLDFSSYIEIPSYLVDESVQYGQRDLILKILGESQPTEKIVKFEKNIFKDCMIKKLISLLSRRILLILTGFSKEVKNLVDISNLIKIFKLTLLENNIGKILNIRNWFYPKNDTEENLEKSVIEYNLRFSPTYIIKNFLYNLSEENNTDKAIVEELIKLDIFDQNNFIEEYLITNIKTEEELIKFEIMENDLKIIFSIFENEKLNSLINSKDYHMKLIHVLAINNEDISLKNPKMGEFAIDAMNTIFSQINSLLENEKEKKSLDYIIESLNNYKFLFTIPEFNKFIEKVDDCVNLKNQNEGNLREIKNIDLKIINLLISIYDMIFTLYIRFDIDMNTDIFLNNKFIDLYFSYSLLNNKLEKYETFILFLMKNQLNLDSDSKNKILIDKFSQKIEFDYYFQDTNSSIAHLMKYEFPENQDVNLKVSYIDPEYFNSEQIAMIYSLCKDDKLEFQDYINVKDLKKKILIKNNKKNNFLISLPHGNFKTNLHNFGNNDMNSLGCGYNDAGIYYTPAPAVGIDSKNIYMLKYGFYHSFAVTTDNKVYICGKDLGSGSKNLKENPFLSNYNLDNYYNDIAKEHGIESIWANNFNTTIMITKDNQLYGSGKNTDGILCDLASLDSDVEIPTRLPDIPEKLKLMACGFKSCMYLTENHYLYSIGCNQYYECGNRENTNIIREYFKVEIPSDIKITNVVAGENFFIFLGKDEYKITRLYSIGCNNIGQCGMDTDQSGKFNICKGTENLEFKIISSRNSSSAAITVKGELFTFGSNYTSNLGHEGNRNILTPKKVGFFNDFIVDEVSISHNHMLVICRDKEGMKKLYSVGLNDYGCLGMNHFGNISEPRECTYFTNKIEDGVESKKLYAVKVSTSRFQSFVLGLTTEFENDKNNFEKKCFVCEKGIKGCMYIQNFPEKKDSLENAEEKIKLENIDNVEVKVILEQIVDGSKKEDLINENNEEKNFENLIEINNEKKEEIKQEKKEKENIFKSICDFCLTKINKKNQLSRKCSVISENEKGKNTIEREIIKEEEIKIEEILPNEIYEKIPEIIDEETIKINALKEIDAIKEKKEQIYIDSLNNEITDLLYYFVTPYKKDIETNYTFDNFIKTKSQIESILIENFYLINKDNKENKISENIFLNFEKEENLAAKKITEDFIYSCTSCKVELNELYNQVFLSTENSSLILCRFCSLNNPNCLRYPQVFYCLNRYRINKKYLIYLPQFFLSEILYGVKKSAQPYLTIKLENKINDLEKIKSFKKYDIEENLFEKCKKLNEPTILQFNELIDNKEFKNSNTIITSSELYKFVNKVKGTENEFLKLNKLEQNSFKILEKLTVSLNQGILLLSSIINNSNEINFIQKVISKNLNLISPSRRLNIFWKKFDRLRKCVNPNETAITFNRMKAIRFYEKGIPDTVGENTIFKQLFSKMKKFPIKNYLCDKNDRLFRVYFKGEGATDMGGPYREVFSNLSDELLSDYLDLFIKTPNSKNDIGNLRDKYIPNPSSKSSNHHEMYYFIGCLIASAIASGQLLSLNLHPIVWKMVLNREINFHEFETIDKLFCKVLHDLENCESIINNEKEFSETYELYFTIQTSDKAEVELIPNGKKTKVTLENKNKYILMAKSERLREFKSQIESIRYGLM